LWASRSDHENVWSQPFRWRDIATGSTRKERQTNKIVVGKSILDVNRKTSDQLPTVYKIFLNSPKFQSMHKWVLFHQEFLVRWEVLGSSLQWHSTPRPPCYIAGCKRCSSDGTTSKSRQEWGRVIAEATKFVRFVVPIDLCCGCLNISWHREKYRKELQPHVYRLAIGT
jgi:hypothetical protein